MELERTTSLLNSREKKRRKRNKPEAPRHEPHRATHAPTFSVEDAAFAEGERKAALAHRTSLLTKMPRNNRLRSDRKQKASGLLMQLILVLATVGAVFYVLDPTILPADLQDIDWDALKDRAVAAVEEALQSLQ